MDFFWRYPEFFLRERALRSAIGPCTRPAAQTGIGATVPLLPDFGIDTEGDRQSGGGSNVQFVFAEHTLDIDRRELRRGAEPIAVEPQVLDLLIYVLQNRNRVVTKDDLIASIWGGRIVSDATLTSRIYAARKAVGDDGHGQKLIRTIARKGLRFVADVHTQANGHDAAPPSEAPVEDARKPSHRSSPHSERPAIAVLPFDNMCGDPAQEYFSDGISEDLITALSKLRRFFVIARNSSFIYKGKAVHMKQVAEELGVDYVVEGSVRRLGDQVRITAQLNDVITGSHVWAERYDRDIADVFAVQDEITEAIVAAIEPEIYAAENFRTLRKPPERLDAWDLLMRALSHYWRVTRQDNAETQALLEKAIAIDPNYGQALGLLATSHMFGVHMGWADKNVVAPIAERAALAALRADGEEPWAHHALGCTHLFARRFDEALAEFELRAAPQPELLAGAGLSRPGARLLRPLGGGRRDRPARAAPEPARSVFGDLLRRRLLCPVCRPQLRRGDADGARRHPPAQRLRRRLSRARRGGRHGGTGRGRGSGTPRAAPGAAQHLARLDHRPDAVQARRRPRPLSRRLPPRGAGVGRRERATPVAHYWSADLLRSGFTPT